MTQIIRDNTSPSTDDTGSNNSNRRAGFRANAKKRHDQVEAANRANDKPQSNNPHPLKRSDEAANQFLASNERIPDHDQVEKEVIFTKNQRAMALVVPHDHNKSDCDCCEHSTSHHNDEFGSISTSKSIDFC